MAAVEAAWGDLECRALRCPPLSCRTSPPQGGRLAVATLATGQSPPLRGRCPAGQRGARQNASVNKRPAIAPSPSAPPASATSPSHSRPIAAARKTAAPTITIQSCRHATSSWPSAYGCKRASAAMRSFMSARTARWNGCLARRWRSAKTAFPKSSPAGCRSSIPSSSAIPAKPRRPSAVSPPSPSAICRLP